MGLGSRMQHEEAGRCSEFGTKKVRKSLAPIMSRSARHNFVLLRPLIFRYRFERSHRANLRQVRCRSKAEGRRWREGIMWRRRGRTPGTRGVHAQRRIGQAPVVFLRERAPVRLPHIELHLLVLQDILQAHGFGRGPGARRLNRPQVNDATMRRR